MLQAQYIAQYGTFTTPIVDLATTQDGTLLAVAALQGDIELWDIATNSRLSTLPIPASHHGGEAGTADEVYSLAISDDGLFLAASFLKTGDISIWTFEGELLSTIEGGGNFTRTVCFLPQTSLLVIVLQDTQIQLWDIATQQLQALLPGADEVSPQYLSGVGRRYLVTCSSAGSQIALHTGTNRSMVCIWHIQRQNGQIMCEDQHVFQWSKEDFFNDVQFRPEHHHLYHLIKKTIEGYDTTTFQRVASIKHAGVLPVNYCFSPEGKHLAFADYDGRVYLWHMETGEPLLQFDACDVGDTASLYYDMSVQRMIWLPQSNLLATAGLKKNDGSGINTVKLWQIMS